MNIKINLSGLLNILAVILVLILIIMSAGCTTDPHGLRRKAVGYDNIVCGTDISVATCDYLVKRK